MAGWQQHYAVHPLQVMWNAHAEQQKLRQAESNLEHKEGGEAMSELLLCPFCGGEASRIAAQQSEDGTYYPAACGCSKCGIWRWGESDYGHNGFATKEDCKESMEQAVSKWNTRMPEQAIAAALGQTEQTLQTLWLDTEDVESDERLRFVCPECGSVSFAVRAMTDCPICGIRW